MAVAVESLSPRTAAIDSSPMKSPTASRVIVASLPAFETTVSRARPFCRKKIDSAELPLKKEYAVGLELHNSSSQTRLRQKLCWIESLANLLCHMEPRLRPSQTARCRNHTALPTQQSGGSKEEQTLARR
jgi:hypothetical protein